MGPEPWHDAPLLAVNNATEREEKQKLLQA
jgi:hypothetical protein